MESHEAMRLTVGTDALKVAKRLGRSTSLISKWCEPSTDFSDSGALNPLDRLEMTIEVALNEGRKSGEAFAPIYYLSQRFGGLFLPPVKHQVNTLEYSKQLCGAVKEAGEAFAAAAEALEDDVLSNNERRRISKELHEALAAMAAFARLVDGQGRG
ncbi:phage regulatory CII family protein [uncultured Desulfuromusa sp.]|uniref:phage regulatory CII family protein n=1 Tax=uncultured Desulfuromusa sp. TaxID=219183 RepID=UPI002AA779B0|nr:phage regulatory CII family protein [uncultured Desulfuromusa sp.]